MLGRHGGDFIRTEGVARDGRRLQRKRLRGPWLVAGDGVVVGDLPFLDAVDRFAGGAVENEDQSLPGALRERGNFLSFLYDIDQGRRGGRVIIPVVVMGGLEIPLELAFASPPVAFPSGAHGPAPDMRFSKLDSRPVDASVYASLGTSGHPAQDSRSRWFATPCLVGLFHPRLRAGLSRRLRSLAVAAQK